MSLFGDFHVPADAFALQETLSALPDARIEVERVVATEAVLTPYFWVTGVDFEAFETAAATDPSVSQLHQLDTFDETALYRAEWTDNIESIVYAYTQIRAVILEAVGTAAGWRLQMRFDGHEQLQAFQDHCADTDIEFRLLRLHELSQPLSGEQYGLTDRQADALRTAWEAGYFDTPREASLEAVADELDISQQSLSNLLRRGHRSLVGSTLMIVPEPDE